MNRLILILCVSLGFSQQNSDIYVFDLKLDGKKFTIDKGENITNRSGYDNQPSFSSDGMKLYYSSDHADKLNHIFVYDLTTKEEKQITSSVMREYSPIETPKKNHISYVQAHGQRQRIIRMNLETGETEKIRPDLTRVGYHCWVTDDKIAIFEAVRPSVLHIIDANESDDESIIESVGRSLFVDPVKKKLLFFQYNADAPPMIHELDELDDDDTKEIISMKRTSNDFFVLENGTIFSTDKHLVYKYLPGKDENWTVVFNGKPKGMHKLSRVAVNKQMTKIAIVTERDDKEQ